MGRKEKEYIKTLADLTKFKEHYDIADRQNGNEVKWNNRTSNLCLGTIWCNFTNERARLQLVLKHNCKGLHCESICMHCRFNKSDPWGRMLVSTVVLCTLLWLVSVVNQTEAGGSDPSIVDRLWSILPIVYAWHMFFSAENANLTTNPRLCVMVVLISAWGMRLTYNFYIKGGFTGGEDYRWELIRKWFPG